MVDRNARDDDNNEQMTYIHLLCWALNPFQPSTFGALSVWEFLWHDRDGGLFPYVFCAIRLSPSWACVCFHYPASSRLVWTGVGGISPPVSTLHFPFCIFNTHYSYPISLFSFVVLIAVVGTFIHTL
ncbi:hypothetical protein BJX76DRAFT_212679 [Aspergillus varians]